MIVIYIHYHLSAIYYHHDWTIGTKSIVEICLREYWMETTLAFLKNREDTSKNIEW